MVQPVHDPPTEDVLDDPLVAVKLNAIWWGHVMGLFSEAASQDYWASDQVRGEDSAIQMLDLMAKGNAVAFDPLSVKVKRTSGKSIAHNIDVVVDFNSELYDVGDLWDVAFPTIVNITESGMWAIGAGVRWVPSAVGERVAFITSANSGVLVRIQNQPTAVDSYYALTTIWKFTAPDTLTLTVKQTSGAALTLRPFTKHSITLWAHFLGPL